MAVPVRVAAMVAESRSLKPNLMPVEFERVATTSPEDTSIRRAMQRPHVSPPGRITRTVPSRTASALSARPTSCASSAVIPISTDSIP